MSREKIEEFYQSVLDMSEWASERMQYSSLSERDYHLMSSLSDLTEELARMLEELTEMMR